MLFSVDGLPVPCRSMKPLFQGRVLIVIQKVLTKSVMTSLVYQCISWAFLAVLGIDYKQQADPREVFVHLVGEHYPQW